MASKCLAIMPVQSDIYSTEGIPHGIFIREVIPMTLNNVIDQLYDLSVAGFFNREKYTKAELKTYIHSFFRPEIHTKVFTMEIALPDGWWHFEIHQDPRWGYDYIIPETREQEALVIQHLLQRAGIK